MIIIGAGGHAKVLIDALKLMAANILGISDTDPSLLGKKILGVPVRWNDQEIQVMPPESVYLINGLGGVRDTIQRRSIFELFKSLDFTFSQVIHPAAVISGEAVLAEGVQVMAGAIVQAGSLIAEDTLINTKASVDHDCRIGRHVHLAPGVTVCGHVVIGEAVFVGSGATVIQGVKIGKNSLIAAGTLVRRDVPPGSKVMGVPGRDNRL